MLMWKENIQHDHPCPSPRYVCKWTPLERVLCVWTLWCWWDWTCLMMMNKKKTHFGLCASPAHHTIAISIASIINTDNRYTSFIFISSPKSKLVIRFGHLWLNPTTGRVSSDQPPFVGNLSQRWKCQDQPEYAFPPLQLFQPLLCT